jgi:hypothetical protein
MPSKTSRTPIDPLAFAFYFFMVMISSMAFRAADWADHLDLVAIVAAIGALAGLALVRSTFSHRTAIFFSTVYGIFIVVRELSLTLDPALIWRDRILAFLGRVGVFFSTILHGEPNNDSLMFVFLMACLYWAMSSFGVWWIFRKEGFWAGVLPLGLAIFLNQVFYVGRAKLDGYLILHIFFVLMIAARLVLWRRQILWRKMRAHVPETVPLYISRTGIVIALVLVVLSWGGPAFATSESAGKLWVAITSPFQEIREHINDILAGLRTSAVVTVDYFGSNLPLVAGTEPEDVLVMYVSPERMPKENGRFYWFSRVYNYFTEGYWYLTIGEPTQFDPDAGNLTIPEYMGREIITVQFEPKISAIHRFSMPSLPLWVNRSGFAEVLLLPNDEVEPLTITAENAIFNGETYESRGSIAIPKADDLRQAGNVYPDWIVSNYLQIPSTITERTRDLAYQLTEGLDNPYDKALAITTWLRRNIEYSRVTDPPPEHVETIDWFLFDYKIGFCNWYASAEVIMLRILGIPSRIAVGFAQGSFNSDENYYEVRGGDAHAWPEVYFPGYGWVEFEPTVSEPALMRPEARLDGQGVMGPETDSRLGLEEGVLDTPRDEGLSDALEYDESGDFFASGAWRQSLIIVLASLSGSVMVLLLWLYIDPVSRALALGRIVVGLQRIGVKPPQGLVKIKLQNLSAIGKVYARWCLWLHRLDLGLTSTQTPDERAEIFSEAHPEAADASWKIVHAYTAERFGGLSAKDRELREAWGRLRSYLWLEWIKLRIDPFLHGKSYPRVDADLPSLHKK